MKNTNKKFGTMWAYILLALAGAITFLYGSVTAFTGNFIPGICTAACGGAMAYYFGKKAIDKDKE